MRTPSPDLSIPLSEAELDELTEILLARFDEDSEPVDGDEGVLDVSELDGLLTAVVSSPVTILPSQWLPVLWGDFPPVFETEAEVERVFSLMLPADERHCAHFDELPRGIRAAVLLPQGRRPGIHGCR
jgi:yecA family protein